MGRPTGTPLTTRGYCSIFPNAKSLASFRVSRLPHRRRPQCLLAVDHIPPLPRRRRLPCLALPRAASRSTTPLRQLACGSPKPPLPPPTQRHPPLASSSPAAGSPLAQRPLLLHIAKVLAHKIARIMSFSGVSVVADGRLLKSSSAASAIYSGTAGSGSWWYHLLVLQGYSRTKGLPNGKRIKGCSFRAGGYRWALRFHPNGCRSEDVGFITVFLVLDQDVARPVKVHLQFSFIDELDKQEHALIRAIKTCDFSGSASSWGRRRFIKVEDLDKSEHLKDDCFTIRCDFIIAEAAAAAPLIEVPPSNISEHLNHLFVTKVGADVTFKVGHETFAAHRCVLASRSAVFMAELFGPMKEGIATADAIQIQDMEPNVFKALLSFVYTDSMPKIKVEGEAGEAVAKVTWLRHLLGAADRFDLQRLKSMCEERLCRLVDLSSVTAILGLAAQHHCPGLKEACLEFLKVQPAAILEGIMATSDWQHISATEPSVLNELIAKFASKA